MKPKQLFDVGEIVGLTFGSKPLIGFRQPCLKTAGSYITHKEIRSQWIHIMKTIEPYSYLEEILAVFNGFP
jgi:hypothetical protein